LTQLSGFASGNDDRQPNWSPHGDRIVFQRCSGDNGDWDILTMAADGTDVRNVTGTFSEDTDASWSPDGRYIVYSSDFGDLSEPEIFVIPASGGTPTRLTFTEGYYKGAPSWSPDGRWVAFEASLESGGEYPTAIMRVSVPERFIAEGN
jgi:TolB protein